MIIGVTGSRHGATRPQEIWLMRQFIELKPTGLHHGGCDGVDWLVHMMAGVGHVHITVHPASGSAAKWTHQGCLIETPDVTVLPAKPPLDRNHDIVDVSDIMLGVPDGPERLRSGTWSTIRYASAVGKKIEVCYPSGDVVPF